MKPDTQLSHNRRALFPVYAPIGHNTIISKKCEEIAELERKNLKR